MLEKEVNNEDNHIPVIGRGESIAVKQLPPDAEVGVEQAGVEEAAKNAEADIELLQPSKGWAFPKVKVGDA